MEVLKIVFLFCFAAVSLAQNIDKICDKCKCDSTEDNRFDIICVFSFDVIDLNTIKWPKTEKAIYASFQGLGLTTVHLLPESDKVVSLDFNNNKIINIWPEAFSNLKNLQYLSLAYNSLQEIKQDMFTKLVNLRELDLSENKLKEFNSLDFQELVNLEILNLNGNLMTHVPTESLNKLPSLQSLLLSKNQFIFLDLGDVNKQLFMQTLKLLDLSNNKLTVIVKDMFENALVLEELNLSNNNIKNIDQSTFTGIKSLKKLDLSFNEISSIDGLSLTIEILYLSHNKFKEWPAFPDNIKELDMSQNDLYTIYDENKIFFDKIEFLNISNNQILKYDATKPLNNLRVLDVSNNYLEFLPKYFSTKNIPMLEELYVDGNPLIELKFEDSLKLKYFSANNLPKITTIKSLNLFERSIDVNDGEHMNTDDICIEIHISHCKRLHTIESEVFIGIPLCYLDISYNNISTLPQNIADWTSVKHGVNLQGNPWDCECHIQWMLGDVLELFYKTHPSLLNELRCETPRHYKRLRFVHWYQHTERAFCVNALILRKNSDYVLQASVSEETLPENYVLSIVLYVIITVFVIIIFSLIVYLARGRYQQNQRAAQLAKRKRQTPKDGQNGNGQNIALTGV